MKASLFLFICLLSCNALHAQSSTAPMVTGLVQPDVSMQAQDNKTFFIENKGQWPAEVNYLASINGMNAWLTSSGVTCDVLGSTNANQQQGHVLRMKMIQGGRDTKAIGQDLQPGIYNYFYGKEEANWGKGARRFKEVLVRSALPHTDVRYYFDNSNLRYDYILSPGAQTEAIRMHVEGLESNDITTTATELHLKTSAGTLTQSGLYAYQVVGGNKEQVACNFIKHADGTIGFTANWKYKNLPLVIDPVLYSTYLGGSGDDAANAMVVDVYGRMNITGSTNSAVFPTHAGAYSRSNAGNKDVFVTILNAAGNGIEFSTYLGSTGNDEAFAIDVDASGNIYVAGSTSSTSFPVTAGSYAVNFSGGADGFVAKFNTTLSQLLNSTYLGGSADDKIAAMKVSGNNVIVAGTTTSSNYPVTPTAYNGIANGSSDAFMTALNATGSALVFSSYLGTSGTETCSSMTIDTAGNICLAGTTTSSTFPTTANALNTSFGGGTTDAFFAKLNPTATALLYSTYLGGNGTETDVYVATNSFGETILTGGTQSSNFPTTAQSFGNGYSVGSVNGYITKIDPSGTSLVYSGFLAANTQPRAVAADGAGNAYVAGTTSATNFPLFNPFSVAYGGGISDAFVLKLNAAGSSLDFSTYLGGGDDETASAVWPDGHGNIYTVGTTKSINFPISANPYAATNAGSTDVFAAKIIAFGCPAAGFASANGPSAICEGGTLSLNATGGVSYHWRGPSGYQFNGPAPFINNIGLNGSGNYIVEAYNPQGCRDEDTLSLTVYPLPTPQITYASDTLLTGAYAAYQWYKNGVSLNPDGLFQYYIPGKNAAGNGDYAVVVTTAAGCTGTSNIITLSGLYISATGQQLGVGIFPNPVQQTLHLQGPDKNTIKLYDLRGKLLINRQNVKQVDVSTLPKGTYILLLYDEKETLLLREKVQVL